MPPLSPDPQPDLRDLPDRLRWASELRPARYPRVALGKLMSAIPATWPVLNMHQLRHETHARLLWRELHATLRWRVGLLGASHRPHPREPPPRRSPGPVTAWAGGGAARAGEGRALRVY